MSLSFLCDKHHLFRAILFHFLKILQHRFPYVRNFRSGGRSPRRLSSKSATGTPSFIKLFRDNQGSTTFSLFRKLEELIQYKRVQQIKSNLIL
jgi:hypothetical protein